MNMYTNKHTNIIITTNSYNFYSVLLMSLLRSLKLKHLYVDISQVFVLLLFLLSAEP